MVLAVVMVQSSAPKKTADALGACFHTELRNRIPIFGGGSAEFSHLQIFYRQNVVCAAAGIV